MISRSVTGEIIRFGTIKRSVFYTKILPHIVQQKNKGIRSVTVVEQESNSIKGLVIPEVAKEFPRIVSDSKGNGFKTTVKIWEEGHICPPHYNIHIEW